MEISNLIPSEYEVETFYLATLSVTNIMPNSFDDIRTNEWGHLWNNTNGGTLVSETLTYINCRRINLGPPRLEAGDKPNEPWDGFNL